MKLCFATSNNVNTVWQEKLALVGSPDVLAFGFNGLGLVSYKKELSGETEYFADVARLSKTLSSVVISGADTDTYGVFRHSAVIADKGRLLGVTDSCYTIGDGEFSSGGGLRVYQTSRGRIGLIVCEDLYFFETAKTLALCDVDIIFCLFKQVENYMPRIMLRANAFSNGVAMALVANDYACLTDIRGNIKAESRADLLKAQIRIEKDYHQIGVRRRGFTMGYGGD